MTFNLKKTAAGVQKKAKRALGKAARATKRTVTRVVNETPLPAVNEKQREVLLHVIKQMHAFKTRKERAKQATRDYWRKHYADKAAAAAAAATADAATAAATAAAAGTAATAVVAAQTESACAPVQQVMQQLALEQPQRLLLTDGDVETHSISNAEASDAPARAVIVTSSTTIVVTGSPAAKGSRFMQPTASSARKCVASTPIARKANKAPIQTPRTNKTRASKTKVAPSMSPSGDCRLPGSRSVERGAKRTQKKAQKRAAALADKENARVQVREAEKAFGAEVLRQCGIPYPYRSKLGLHEPTFAFIYHCEQRPGNK